MASTPQRRSARAPQSDTLADILERVLETGIVIAGDIKVNLNDVELLTIQIRLVVCSVDKADEMGIDWWKDANYLSEATEARVAEGNDDESETLEAVNQRLARLERRLDALAEDKGASPDSADDSDEPVE